MTDIKAFFADASDRVNLDLERLIPPTGEGPPALREAMRWSLFGGGKRFRPALLFAVGRTFGADDEDLVRTASAIEMIHTYSLIHDDLPSMDDDDLRRGRETCHKKFGEATAILAGDALQVLAFQAIAEEERLDIKLRVDLIKGLSRAAVRMVVGQELDLEAEGRPLELGDVMFIHSNKTGALIEFSADAGAKIAGASESDGRMIASYASTLGLLFQVTDDLLDVTSSTDVLGKTAGKDKDSQKATYPSVLGVEATNETIGDLYAAAVNSMESLGARGDLLRSIASMLVERRS